eukprot:2727533-Pyramimonas_sp.AAC.1
MLTIAWSTLHGTGTTKQTRNVFTSIPKSWICDGVLEAVFTRLAWSFNALTEGVLPHCDWKGAPTNGGGRELANGWRIAVIFCGADWEFYSSVCKFPTGQSVPNCCWLCNASPHEGHLCCFNVSSDAGWRGTLRSHESYLRNCVDTGAEPCVLMKIKTLRLEGFLPDAMHGMGEGFTAEVAGNVMYEFMEAPGWGSNQKERAARLNDDLQKHYKTTKESVRVDGKITYERVKASGDWPLLKAKAAATRHITPYLVELAE